MPITVARGIVRSGSLTSSAGTVADSRPMKAQRVRSAAALMPQSKPLESVNGSKLRAVHEEQADHADHEQRDELEIVVTTWTMPAARTPTMLTSVRIQMSAMATSTATQFVATSPQKTAR